MLVERALLRRTCFDKLSTDGLAFSGQTILD